MVYHSFEMNNISCVKKYFILWEMEVDKIYKDPDVFEAYSQLCARNVRTCRHGLRRLPEYQATGSKRF
nr:hypothetical protein [Tanacetum cinerariifolium]